MFLTDPSLIRARMFTIRYIWIEKIIIIIIIIIVIIIIIITQLIYD